MEDLSYAYLHCDLLERVALTAFILRVKSLHVKTHEQHLQKDRFVKVEILALNQSLKGVFKKVTCMLSLYLN
jgi:hypothetical protein